MAKAEYVKLAPTEIFYGEKNLFESQLALTALIKQVKLFHEIRNEELLLKLQLKRKLDEVKLEFSELGKLLPRTSDEPEEIHHRQKELPEEEISLSKELSSIKQKLSALKS